MRIFNVGIREVILLLVIMLILFGPKQMQENARKTAQWIRRFVHSDTWRSFLGIVDDVNSIKDQVIRESGIQEVQDSLKGINRQLNEFDTDIRKTSAQIHSVPYDSQSIKTAEPTGEIHPPQEEQPTNEL